MIIKSTFKDYYDHIAHIYGGGDPKIIYPRVKLNKDYLVGSTISVKTKNHITGFCGFNESSKRWTKTLVICAKAYLLIKEDGESEYKLVNEKDHPEFFTGKRQFNKDQWSVHGQYLPDFLELCRSLNTPVLTFDRVIGQWQKSIEVDCNIPNLGQLGVASLIPPEQMYQDISYFIANTMNGSPDIQPEGNPGLTDKERISSHGFDLKQSFRHRK